MPTLDDAERRIRQSKRRLFDLTGQIETFRETQTGIVDAQRTRSDPHQFKYRLTDPLDDLTVIISEIVQHLITALNYLVCALAEVRGKPVDENLQFPICDTPQAFRARVSSELRRLSGQQVALIEQFQPYNDNRWLGVVRDLANPDKHRHPIKISAGPGRISFHALSHTPAKTPHGIPVLMPDTVQMQYNFGLPIVFIQEYLNDRQSGSYDR
jgi:hypothetical protein